VDLRATSTFASGRAKSDQRITTLHSIASPILIMLSDVNMDDPDESAKQSIFPKQAQPKFQSFPTAHESQQQRGGEFGFPSMPLQLEPNSASGSSDSITGGAGTTQTKDRNPMTTPQKPIQLGGGAKATPTGSGPASGLSRRMSGKMSLGSLGSASPQDLPLLRIEILNQVCLIHRSCPRLRISWGWESRLPLYTDPSRPHPR
jgi:hypothetical protein